MASSSSKHLQNQVSSVHFSASSSRSETPVQIRGHSKSQMCLRKIMEIILSQSSPVSTGSLLRPCEFSKGSSWELEKQKLQKLEAEKEGEKMVKRVSDMESEENEQEIDLVLRLGPPEIKVAGNHTGYGGFNDDSACSAVGERGSPAGKVCRIDCNSSLESGNGSAVQKSSQGECNPKSVENLPENFPPDGDAGEFSEITIFQGRGDESSQGKCGDGSSNEDLCFSSGQPDRVDVSHDENERMLEEEAAAAEKGGERDLVPLTACTEPEKVTATELEETRNKRKASEGYLDLLLEAVRLVSGNSIESEKASAGDVKAKGIAEEKTESNPMNSKQNNKRCWMLELFGGFDDSAPVVKSKRGRNQVLPSRYRDSVLEPWKRFPRQRSKGSAKSAKE